MSHAANTRTSSEEVAGVRRRGRNGIRRALLRRRSLEAIGGEGSVVVVVGSCWRRRFTSWSLVTPSLTPHVTPPHYYHASHLPVTLAIFSSSVAFTAFDMIILIRRHSQQQFTVLLRHVAEAGEDGEVRASYASSAGTCCRQAVGHAQYWFYRPRFNAPPWLWGRYAVRGLRRQRFSCYEQHYVIHVYAPCQKKARREDYSRASAYERWLRVER